MALSTLDNARPFDRSLSLKLELLDLMLQAPASRLERMVMRLAKAWYERALHSEVAR